MIQTPLHLSGKFLQQAVQERIGDGDDGRRPGQIDVWSGIDKPVAAPYVHPLVRRSSSSMSSESLQICTESLGSENGSDDFADRGYGRVEVEGEEERKEIEFAEEKVEETEESPSTRRRGTELAAVNYLCSSVGRRSPPRLFPPPLTSISHRDGPCLHMVSHRRDGRLVVEAVPVPSRNYLHASRKGGRLLLSIVGAIANYGDQNEEKKATEVANSDKEAEAEEGEEEALAEEEDEEEEEEEVEVVDRGTMVEVKVSTQPQQQSTGAAAKKILRSSLVINKFVGGTPENKICTYPIQPESLPLRPTTATAAAAAVADSTISASSELESMVGPVPDQAPPESSLLFTSKRRNREAMLLSMRRCRQFWRPLFFWEPCSIATSS